MTYIRRVFHANALTRVFQDYRSFRDGVMDPVDAMCSVHAEFRRILIEDRFGYELATLMFDEISEKAK